MSSSEIATYLHKSRHRISCKREEARNSRIPSWLSRQKSLLWLSKCLEKTQVFATQKCESFKTKTVARFALAGRGDSSANYTKLALIPGPRSWKLRFHAKFSCIRWLYISKYSTHCIYFRNTRIELNIIWEGPKLINSYLLDIIS